MTTTKKWGGVFLGIVLIGLLAVFVVAQPDNPANLALAQDQILLGAASDLHPTEVFAVTTPANSLPEAFQTAGSDWHPEDKTAYFPDYNLGIGTVVTVQRALPITLIDGKRKTTVRTWATTVGELLTEKKIELGKDDKIAPTLTTTLAKNTTVTITRVAVTEITTNSSIAFNVIKKNDPTLDEGKTRIDRAGITGTLASTYRVTREFTQDGDREVARVLLSTLVIKVSQDQLVSIGTKPVISVACRYNDLVLAAAIKYGLSANALCYRMMRESHGNPNIDGRYKGLFQYDPGYWASISAKAGHPGASIFDPVAQTDTTGYAWSHGDRGRWPQP